jgi:hypothetical protein
VDGGNASLYAPTEHSSNTTSVVALNHREDYRWPASRASAVWSGICSQGGSVQTSGMGLSLSTGNSVCDFVAITANYIALGNAEPVMQFDANGRNAFQRAREAADLGFDAAKRRNRLSVIRNYLTLGFF